MADQINIVGLPPTQYLVLEVLAARARTGEYLWTFPSNLGPALRALESAGLISTMHGVAPASLRARLTDIGRSYVLKGDYVPPLAQQVLDAVEEGMKSAAELLTAAGGARGTEHGLGVAYAIPKVKAHVRGAVLGLRASAPNASGASDA